jgi:hypothetical protein
VRVSLSRTEDYLPPPGYAVQFHKAERFHHAERSAVVAN